MSQDLSPRSVGFTYHPLCSLPWVFLSKLPRTWLLAPSPILTHSRSLQPALVRSRLQHGAWHIRGLSLSPWSLAEIWGLAGQWRTGIRCFCVAMKGRHKKVKRKLWRDTLAFKGRKRFLYVSSQGLVISRLLKLNEQANKQTKLGTQSHASHAHASGSPEHCECWVGAPQGHLPFQGS